METANDNKLSLGSYGKSVLLGAPVAMARSATTVPTKLTEARIEGALARYMDKAPQLTASERSATTRRLIKRALAFGATGGVVGALTLPLFTRASHLMASDDPKERRKGVALMGAQGLAFSAIKATPDAAIDEKLRVSEPVSAPKVERKSVANLTDDVVKLADQSAALRRIGRTARGRFIGAATIGVPTALALAASVANERRKERSNPNYKKGSGYVIPALVGAGAGAGASIVENAIEHAGKVRDAKKLGQALPKLTRASALRLFGPKAGAYAAAGLLSGLVAKPLTELATKRLRTSAPTVPVAGTTR